MKDLTRERALELHRQMWSDMQRDLGDTPMRMSRIEYKQSWIAKHFPGREVCNNCFLCEYDRLRRGCDDDDWTYSKCECLIRWPKGRCEDGLSIYCEKSHWGFMPISELLALPEREDVE